MANPVAKLCCRHFFQPSFDRIRFAAGLCGLRRRGRGGGRSLELRRIWRPPGLVADALASDRPLLLPAAPTRSVGSGDRLRTRADSGFRIISKGAYKDRKVSHTESFWTGATPDRAAGAQHSSYDLFATTVAAPGSCFSSGPRTSGISSFSPGRPCIRRRTIPGTHKRRALLRLAAAIVCSNGGGWLDFGVICDEARSSVLLRQPRAAGTTARP